MKVLGMATGLVLALVCGVLFWALANGTPMSGEPAAVLLINQGAKQAGAPRPKSVSPSAGEQNRGGQMEVVLDVTPGGKRKRSTTRAHKRQSAGLFESSEFGPLPQRASDGRTPSGAYIRQGQGHPGTKPRIAILLTGLGLHQGLSQLAVNKLPGEVTLAFSAYGRNLGRLVDQARSRGHELMLQVPMEPLDYPVSDTGPKTLMVKHSEMQNRPLLHWALGRFTGYFGVVNNKGGRYLANRTAAAGLFRELQRRGLFFFRDKAAGGARLSQLAGEIGLGYSEATLELDRQPSASGISKALHKLEAAAQRTGIAVGVVHMHSVSIDMISKWAIDLDRRGLELVPVSAAYGRQ